MQIQNTDRIHGPYPQRDMAYAAEHDGYHVRGDFPPPFGRGRSAQPVPARAPVSLRLDYWTESDQASESCTGKVLYYYVYFRRVNQRSFRQLDYTI